MVAHYRLVPDREGLPLDISMEALRVARLRQTNIPGDIATDGTISAGGMDVSSLQVQGMDIKASIDKMRPQIEQAGAKADQLSGQIDDVRKTVTDQGVRLDGVASDATSALSASSETSQTVSRLSATVEDHYREQTATLDRVSKVEQDVDGFKTTVEATYATKDSVTTLSSQWEQDKDGFTASITQAQSSADRAQSSADDATSGVDRLDTLISLKSDGVTVGRNVNGTPAWNYAKIQSDGTFRVYTPSGREVYAAGQNMLRVNGPSGERRLEMYGDDSNHFYIRLHPLSGSEPVQTWQTGWNDMPLASGMSGSPQWAHRGGLICFRGRVYPPSSTADAQVNANDLPTFKSPTNRNFMCWGMTTGGAIQACNVWIPANQLVIRLGGAGWQWVSLDGLTIPT